jgi:hypothetical protein
LDAARDECPSHRPFAPDVRAARFGLGHGVGAILICLVMLRGTAFSRTTAWVGLATHGLDLAQMLLGIFVPAVKVAIMVVAGPRYLVWFFLIGRRLIQLGRPAPGLPG